MAGQFKGTLLKWQINRQIDTSLARLYQKKFHVTNRFADQLGLEVELEGHNGCVNCLEWSKDGTILVSGSDDYSIILWKALEHKKLLVLPSGHSGNIFSVKIMPSSNDTVIASAAADACVRVHCAVTKECTHAYSCHSQRVKRLATSPQSPYVIWSGSEDGTVRQFDLRQPHRCSLGQSDCDRVLINMASFVGARCEVKCIALNPCRAEEIVVGCNDPFLRLFDMRMLSMKSLNDTPLYSASRSTTAEPVHGSNGGEEYTSEATVTAGNGSSRDGCVAAFCPGHLPRRFGRKPSKRFRHLVTTYAAFSPAGDEILCNLGGEHVYLFSLRDHRQCLRFTTPVNNACGHHAPDKSNGFVAHMDNGKTKNGMKRNGTVLTTDCGDGNSVNGFKRRMDERAMPRHGRANDPCSPERHPHALSLKQSGNDAFASQNYYQAVVFYNQAIQLLNNSSVLYANRAAALLKRNWEGDIYAALRDCHTALLLDPGHYKAFYRQARCLYELRWYEEALECLRVFKERFPDQADGYSTQRLERDIRAMLMRIWDATPPGDHENNEDDDRVQKGVSASELRFQDESYDYDLRFVGACNTTTDIKEANFFGSNGEFVVAGSDCGCLFVWDRKSTNLVEAWHGDGSIVNCLQPHPSICLLATSGIDPVVRLWSPRSKEHNDKQKHRESELESLVKANQRRMNADPLEVMLMNMGYQTSASMRSSAEDGSDTEENADASSVQCRTH